MAEQTYISVYTDQETVARLDAWAQEESRSRNNLMQLIIVKALKQRDVAQRVAAAIEHPLPDGAFPCADADQAA